MTDQLQTFAPENPDSYPINLTRNSPRFDIQHAYQPRQYLVDPNSWTNPPGSIDNQDLGAQTVNSPSIHQTFDAPYDIEHVDPALWQYDGQERYYEQHHSISSIGASPGMVMIDPLPQSPPQTRINTNMMLPQTPNIRFFGPPPPPPPPNETAPARQPFSQVFVVPITTEQHGVESYPDSNGMFCDFPGIAYRSFLPEGVVSPISTTHNSFSPPQGSKRLVKLDRGRPAVTQERSQSQIPKLSMAQNLEKSVNFINSSPYMSSKSRFTTPDIA